MSRLPPLLNFVLLALLLSLGSGCARFGDRPDPLDAMSVEQIYADARRALDSGNMSRAERLYRGLISRFPFGPYTEQAQLELAYAQFRQRKEEEALSTLNRFLRTYPTSPNADYAWYLRGLVNFDRTTGFLDRWLGLDASRRQQTFAVQSFQDFGELIQRYPNSRYAADARQRMVFLRNIMAQHEINVAEYYLRRGAWVAAANRGKHVVENYQDSPQTADALAIMVRAYRELGQNELADGAMRVLTLNFPEHPFVRGIEPESPGLVRRVWRFAGGRG